MRPLQNKILNQMELDHFEMNLPMPVTNQNKYEWALYGDECFTEVLEIVNAVDGHMMCLVECDKGYVQLMDLEMPKSPRLEAVFEGEKIEVPIMIDPKRLVSGVTYDDRLLITYLGGELCIDFTINLAEKSEIQLKTNANEGRRVPKPQKKSSRFYEVYPLKRSFYYKEPIEIQLENHSVVNCHTLIESTGKYLTPGVLEVFLKSHFRIGLEAHLPKVDRFMGLNPFKQQPEIIETLTFTFSGESGKIIQSLDVHLSVYETTLQETKIESEWEAKCLFEKIYKNYIAYRIQGTHAVRLDDCIKTVEIGLNYDLSNIYLRLFYVFLLLENKNKKEALKQISVIETYEHFYEANYDAFVIQSYLALKSWSSGKAQPNSIVRPESHWMLMLLKNRMGPLQSKLYESYKHIYETFAPNVFVLAETVGMLNELPIVPATADGFYKIVLRWAINRKAIHHKWLKKLERNYYLILNHKLMDSNMAYQLYQIEKSEGFLKLFVQLAIAESRYDFKAYTCYGEALRQKMYAKDLEQSYLYASWHVHQTIEMKYLKSIVDTQNLPPEIRCHLYQRVLEEREHQKVFFNRYKTEAISYLQEKEHYNLDDLQLLETAVYQNLLDDWQLIEKIFTHNHLEQLIYCQVDQVISWLMVRVCQLQQLGWLYDHFPVEEIIRQSREADLQMLFQYALSHFEGKELGEILSHTRLQKKYLASSMWFKDASELDVSRFVKAFKGTLNQWVEVHRVLSLEHKNQSALQYVSEIIIFKGFMTRHKTKEVEGFIVEELSSFDKLSMLLESMKQEAFLTKSETWWLRMIFYIGGQIMINTYEPSDGFVLLLEKIVFHAFIKEVENLEIHQDKGQVLQIDNESLVEQRMLDFGKHLLFPLILPLLRSYTLKHPDQRSLKNADILVQLSLKNGIMFPWYDIFVPEEEIDPLERLKVAFTYYGKPHGTLYFYYRFEEQQSFVKTEMTPVGFGIYYLRLNIFYNEVLQYYIKEVYEDGQQSIAMSALYYKSEMDQNVLNHPSYERMNTMMMSQFMGDDASLEASIWEHIQWLNEVQRTMKIL